MDQDQGTMFVNVLEIPIYNNNIDQAVKSILDDLNGMTISQNRCISATGAHGIIVAHQDRGFKQILKSFYWNLPDGMPTVWVAKWKGAKNTKRCYGPDFFKALLIATSELQVKHFFCGGKEGVAEKLRENCRVQFGNNQVTGVYCPPFREMLDEEMQILGTKINESGAGIVWIGLSTPKQEQFAIRLARFTTVSYIITVGAAFDFHTGLLKQAPKWMQELGLEWFFRLLMEPKRLYKRYFSIVPLFIWLNIKEFIEIYAFKKNRI